MRNESEATSFVTYLRQGGFVLLGLFVCLSVCLSVCLFVCLLVIARKDYW